MTRPSTARQRLFAMVGTFLSMSTIASCAPPPVAGTGYELVFQDEFDDGSVGAIWATAPFGGSLPPVEGNGVMTVWSAAANSSYWGYVASTGPRIDTEPSHPFAHAWRYGYFEARIRFTDSDWAWPAFWLFSLAKTEAWPGENCNLLNAEWDIMEGGIGNADGQWPASRATYAVLHRNTTDNTADGYCGLPDQQRQLRTTFPDVDLSQWHTWAGRWTAGELCTYLDDELLGCLEPYDSTPQPMHLVFTMQYLQDCVDCGPRPDALAMDIDWVRVWQQQ